MGTKTILGNREHKETNFRFLGNRGTSQFISGKQRNRYPPGRASFKISPFKVTGKPIFRRTKRIKNEICIPRMHI